MTPQAFLAGLTGDMLAYAENLQAQRDDALARITAYDANAASVTAANQKAVADATAAGKASTDVATAATVAVQAQLDAANATLADAQKLIDSMGGTEVGQQLAKAKAIADAQAAYDAAATTLTALQGAKDPPVGPSPAVLVAPG